MTGIVIALCILASAVAVLALVAVAHARVIRQMLVTMATISFGLQIEALHERAGWMPLEERAKLMQGIIDTLDVIRKHDTNSYKRLAVIASNHGIGVEG